MFIVLANSIQFWLTHILHVSRGHAVCPDPVRLLSPRRQPGLSERRRRAQLWLPHPGVCQVQHGPHQQRNLGCDIRFRFCHFGGLLRLQLRREAAVSLPDADARGASVRKGGGCAPVSAEPASSIRGAALLPGLCLLLPLSFTTRTQLPDATRALMGGLRLSVQFSTGLFSCSAQEKHSLQVLAFFAQTRAAAELPHLPDEIWRVSPRVHEPGRSRGAPAAGRLRGFGLHRAREAARSGVSSPAPARSPLRGLPDVVRRRQSSAKHGGAVRGVRR